jgi:hypothetical protein
MIECWVTGGERIYGNVNKVHLTHINVSIDQTTNHDIARFPMACLKEHGFEEISRQK